MNLVVNFFAKKVLEFCHFWYSTIVNDRIIYFYETVQNFYKQFLETRNINFGKQKRIQL